MHHLTGLFLCLGHSSNVGKKVLEFQFQASPRGVVDDVGIRMLAALLNSVS